MGRTGLPGGILAGQDGADRTAGIARLKQNQADRTDGVDLRGPDGGVRSNGGLPAKGFASFRSAVRSIIHAAGGYRMAAVLSVRGSGVKGGFPQSKAAASK